MRAVPADRRTGGLWFRRAAVAGAIFTITVLAAFRSAGPPVRPSAQDPDPRALIERSARAYQKATSFKAAFRQILADSMIGTYESQGNLVQSGEAKLSMRFTDPAGDAIVMDGEHIWVYTPSTTPNQVIRLKVPSDPTYGPNLLAWFLTNPTERYSSRYLKSDAVAGRGVDVVSLTPLDRNLPFSSATVYLDQFDYLPRRLEVKEKTGNLRTLILTSVETNRRFSPNTFKFDVPGGVKVIDQ